MMIFIVYTALVLGYIGYLDLTDKRDSFEIVLDNNTVESETYLEIPGKIIDKKSRNYEISCVVSGETRKIKFFKLRAEPEIICTNVNKKEANVENK